MNKQVEALAVERIKTLATDVTVSMEEMEAKINAMPVTPTKPFPKVGDSLVILHQVKRTASGDVLGLQRADGKPTAFEITAVYLDGQVQVSSGDVWECKLSHGHGMQAKWETVNPSHAKVD